MKHKILFISLIGLTAIFSCTTAKIQDCPEKKIINRMPTIGESSTPKEYFIYKGQRKEITDFDSTWLQKNCPNIQEEVVY